MNLRSVPTETSFHKLSRPRKNFRCFQKMVQLFNIKRIMLLASLANTSRRKVGKQQLEIIFQLEIIDTRVCKKVLLKKEILPYYQSS